MLKNRNEEIQRLVRVADILVCIAAFGVSFWLRNHPHFGEPGAIGPIQDLAWMLFASIIIHLFLYPWADFYTSLRLKSGWQIIGVAVKAFIVEFFVLGALVFFYQAKTTSRSFFALFLVSNYILILAEKLGARVLLSSIRKRGYNYRQVLIVGTGTNALRVISALRRNLRWGYIPCGVLTDGVSVNGSLNEVPVLGRAEELESICLSRTVDEVYFAPEILDFSKLNPSLQLCEKLGIAGRISLGAFQFENSKLTFSTLEDIPLATFYTTLMSPTQAFIKRAMDLAIALVGLLLTGILFPLLVLMTKWGSPGPIFFKQMRVGENGRKFKCYKFRTMVVDAESRKEALAHSNQVSGPMFKVENDPRVTRFGKFLRKTSLDELPQFLNILRGDMSVVGTRPPTPDEVSQYETHYRRRLSIRPGLTGLWQVSGRNQIKRFEDVLELDLYYIDHWSIWLDLKIIARTVWVSLFGRGAY